MFIIYVDKTYVYFHNCVCHTYIPRDSTTDKCIHKLRLAQLLHCQLKLSKKACSALALLAQLPKKLAQLLTWLKTGHKTDCSFLQFQWYLTCCCMFSIIKTVILSPFYLYSITRIDVNILRLHLYCKGRTQSSHPFGKVHWVLVLTNIKTATGCESNRQFNFEMRLQGRLRIINNLTEFKGWASNKMPYVSLATPNIDSIERSG